MADPRPKRDCTEAQLAVLRAGREKRANQCTRRERAAPPMRLPVLDALRHDDSDDSRLQGALRLHFKSMAHNAAEGSARSMAERLLTKGFPSSTKTVLQELSDMKDPRSLAKAKIVLAELLLLHDRERRARMERGVAYSHGVRKVQYLDIDCQDETPMTLGRREFVDHGNSALSSPPLLPRQTYS